MLRPWAPFSMSEHVQPLDHRVLVQELNGVQWDTLGINLGLSVEEIQEIELDHQTTSRRRSEMLNKWLKKELNPTWLMVLDALEKMSENRLANRLRNAYVASSSDHKPSASSEELELTIGTNDEIAREIEDLTDEYFALIRETESAVEKMNPSLKDLKRFSQFYIGNEVSTVDELFDQLKPFNLLDYKLLQKIVKVFLVAPNTVDDKISDYVKHWENFKTSTTIRQFMESIEQAQQSHSTTSERPGLCIVKICLVGGWMDRTMDDLDKLVKEIFKEKRHVLSHLKIVRGSVIVTFSAPLSEAESLLVVAKEHSSFALQVGVSQLVVADTMITQSESSDFSFESSLLDSVKDNDLHLLNFLLSINTNPNAADQRNQTALHVDNKFNYLLLDIWKDCDLGDVVDFTDFLLNRNLQGFTGYTPLFIASLKGHTDIVDLLLKNNANPDLQGTNGCTPLYIASHKGHTGIVDLLLKNNANPDLQETNGCTSLYIGSHKGHTDIVDLLLKNNANPDLQGTNGCTPLYIASHEGHTGIVDLLLKNNANPDLPRDNSCTPLFTASKKGHTDVVAILLKNNANPDLQEVNGCTPLYIASRYHHTEVVAILLKNNASPDLQGIDGSTPLYAASYMGHTDLVAILLKNNANIDLPKDNGCTPLFIASQHGHSDVVAILLKNNANIDLPRDNGCTPLYIASFNGHTDVVALLLKNNANPDLPRDNGCTPLYVASQNGHTDVVAILLKNNANPDLQRFKLCTPLFIASQEGHTDVVAILLKNNANPDLQETNGYSPLYIASQEGHTDIVDLLLKNNANPDLPSDNYSCTPLFIASLNGHTDVVAILLKYNANPDFQGMSGCTPLHAAIFKGHTDVVDLLLRNNADPDHPDDKGYTPLSTASQYGQAKIVILLLEAKANPNLQDNEYGKTPLILATVHSQIRVVQLLLDNGADPNLQLLSGLSALVLACHSGYLDIAEVLLMSGADPSMKSRGLTAQEAAAREGHEDIVDMLEAIKLSQSSTTSPALTANEIASKVFIDNRTLTLLNEAKEEMLVKDVESFIVSHTKMHEKQLPLSKVT